MRPTGQGHEGRHTRTSPPVAAMPGTLPAPADTRPGYLGGVDESPDDRPENRRPLEPGIEQDFSSQMSYGDYLRLDLLLAAQQPQSDPPQHDELLFIVQHQTSELWLKLLVHELRSARALLRTDDLSPALKRLARVKHIQHVLTDQWSVLATMTPSEYALIRPFLATSSGFQSAQYREVEFLLGNKNADMVKVFAHEPGAQAELETLLGEPSLYDEFLAYLARRGYAVPSGLLERDWSRPHRLDAGLVETFARVYAAPEEHWGVYETCEELVDLEDNFQAWRFRHLQVVQRTIGHKTGTGGSSGVDFLRRALDLTFFPELYEVRSRVGS
jgi:tryptophan 2,3-dioxygenase